MDTFDVNPSIVLHDDPIDPNGVNTRIGPNYRARVRVRPEYAEEGDPFMPHHYNQLLRVLIEIREELEYIADRC